LATVHARDNQPTTNDVTTQPISISASFTKVIEALKKVKTNTRAFRAINIGATQHAADDEV